MAASLKFTLHQYGHHELQRLATWELSVAAAGIDCSTQSYWVIFIHGGAWRAPSSTYRDFIPTIDRLMALESWPQASVRGFASIDYRLSGPAAAPEPARHPDHVQDVRRALDYMDRKFAMNSQYILLGHSVGATLTFQVLMGSQAAGDSAVPVPLPSVAIGIAGIYEFYDFSHRHGDYYIGFVTDALGPQQSAWNNAAPLCFTDSYKAAWPGGRAILMYSPDDSLVDGTVETKNMAECLQRHQVPVQVVDTMRGEHDVAWEDGEDISLGLSKLLAQLSYSS